MALRSLSRRKRNERASAEAPRLPLRFSLELGVVETSADDRPTWVMVAREGDYRGYAAGKQPFKFDRSVFDEVVANIRNHPSYLADATGYGTVDIVPWDFNHGSEQDPTSGSLPVAGAPAQAWTRDFEVRDGSDGVAELWALTRFLEPAKTYVKEKRYKWASVALGFDAIDPVSGANIGAVITSIALTNTPFIEGMAPLAANKRAANKAENKVDLEYYGGAACSAEEALEAVQGLFELSPTSGIEGLTEELGKFQIWVSGGIAPAGADMDELCERLRRIFNLPALCAPQDCATELGKLISLLAQTQSAGLEPSNEGMASSAPPAAVATTKEDVAMNAKLLASKLGVKENDDAIASAIDGLVELRAAMIKSLRLKASASDQVLLDAVEGFAAAQAKIGALLKALGVEDPDGAVAKVTDLMQRASELEKVLPELATLRETQKQTEDDQREQDVAAALSNHFGGKDDSKELLVLFHQTKGRAAFLAKYPVPAPDKAYLTASIAASGAGGAGVVGTTATIDKPTTQVAGVAVINLAGYAGRNRTERIMAYIRGSTPGAEKYTHEQLTEAAWKLGSSPTIKFVEA